MEKLEHVPEKRRSLILNLLREEKFIAVSELVGKLKVSQATIIRDFIILEKKGFITRSYGGAAYLAGNLPYSFDSSSVVNIKEKKAIADTAFSLIKETETVVLNTGVTTLEICKNILNSNLECNIVTNSLKIVDLFAFNNHSNKTILCLGGDLYIAGYGFSGRVTNENMKNIYGSSAIIGIHGIDLKAGLTLPWPTEAELVTTMLQRCNRKIIMAEYVKFGRISLYKVDCDLKDIDIIITDEKTEKKYIDALQDEGINVILAKLT